VTAVCSSGAVGAVGAVAGVVVVVGNSLGIAASRPRSCAALCGRASGALASIAITSASSAGETRGLIWLGGRGSALTC
jgi:hypothetical protein